VRRFNETSAFPENGKRTCYNPSGLKELQKVGGFGDKQMGTYKERPTGTCKIRRL